MKSEKHPEYKMWNDACTAAVTLFKSFRHNKSIESSQVKFDPIISYFNKQVESIDDKDNKGNAMKKTAFNNLLYIMFYLDRHEEVLTLCEKHQNSKRLDKIAKRMMKQSKEQVSLLAFHNMNSRHMENLKDVEGEIETEEVQEVAESE